MILYELDFCLDNFWYHGAALWKNALYSEHMHWLENRRQGLEPKCHRGYAAYRVYASFVFVSFGAFVVRDVRLRYVV